MVTLLVAVAFQTATGYRENSRKQTRHTAGSTDTGFGQGRTSNQDGSSRLTAKTPDPEEGRLTVNSTSSVVCM